MDLKFKTYSSMAFLLIISSVVAAQSGQKHGSDSTTHTVAIVIDSILILINLIFLVACVRIIQSLPDHRYSFIALGGALLLSIARDATKIAYYDFTDPGSSTDDLKEAKILRLVVAFFSFLSYSLFSACFGLVLFDRHRCISREALGRLEILKLGVLLGLVCALFISGSIVSWLDQPINFLGIWGVTTAYIGYLAFSAYKAARIANAQDKISRMMLFAITPLNIVGTIIGIVFTVNFVVLAPDILLGVLYTPISALLLLLGSRPWKWNIYSEAADE